MSKYIWESDLLIIGISGVTCGGKTTTTTQLKNILPNTTIFSQDDYFLNDEDPRHTWIPELNHVNYDILTSLDMAKMYEDILNFIAINNYKPISHRDKIISGTNIENITADDFKMLCDEVIEIKPNILIIEGFSIFNYEPMANLFHLKYYFTLDREECFKRRIKRVYEPPDCPGYFEQCAWPEHLNQLEEVKKMVKNVNFISGVHKNAVEIILQGILTFLQK